MRSSSEALPEVSVRLPTGRAGVAGGPWRFFRTQWPRDVDTRHAFYRAAYGHLSAIDTVFLHVHTLSQVRPSLTFGRNLSPRTNLFPKTDDAWTIVRSNSDVGRLGPSGFQSTGGLERIKWCSASLGGLFRPEWGHEPRGGGP